MGAIVVDGLRKSYGDVEVLRGLSFEVQAGEVVALLGPNGAGKTTTVEILEGFRSATAGMVRVLGHDPARRERELRQRIGVVLQSVGVDGDLTVREAVSLFAGYYPNPISAEAVLAEVGLLASKSTRVGRLSGGQRRRLDLAVAVVGRPEVLFLDEPTTGFDPAARRAAWEVVRSRRDDGVSVVLTTHDMVEAHALADRVVLLVDGRLVAEGAPDTLGGDETEIRFTLPDGIDVGDVAHLAHDVRVMPGRHVSLQVVEPDCVLRDLLSVTGGRLPNLVVRPATLEDVYLRLTTAEADA